MRRHPGAGARPGWAMAERGLVVDVHVHDRHVEHAHRRPELITRPLEAREGPPPGRRACSEGGPPLHCQRMYGGDVGSTEVERPRLRATGSWGPPTPGCEIYTQTIHSLWLPKGASV